jgi:hypothetical protein
LLERVPETFQYLPLELQRDKELQKQAFCERAMSDIWDELSPEIIQEILRDRDMAKRVLQYDPESYLDFSLQLKQDRELAELALQGNPALFEVLPEELQQDEALRALASVEEAETRPEVGGSRNGPAKKRKRGRKIRASKKRARLTTDKKG